MRLVESGSFESALSLCNSLRPVGGAPNAQLADIDVESIREKYGSVLYQKGDFDGAVVQYLAANSDMLSVFSLFPDIAPQQLFASLYPNRVGLGNSLEGSPIPGGGGRLQGQILHRAAAAVVQYCEKKRAKVGWIYCLFTDHLCFLY
jgi:hypothetical protein